MRILLDALIQAVHLAEQVTDDQAGKTGQVLRVVARFATNHFSLERHYAAVDLTLSRQVVRAQTCFDADHAKR